MQPHGDFLSSLERIRKKEAGRMHGGAEESFVVESGFTACSIFKAPGTSFRRAKEEIATSRGPKHQIYDNFVCFWCPPLVRKSVIAIFGLVNYLTGKKAEFGHAATTPPSGNTLGAHIHKKVDIIFKVLFYFLLEDSPSVIWTNPNVFPSQVS